MLAYYRFLYFYLDFCFQKCYNVSVRIEEVLFLPIGSYSGVDNNLDKTKFKNSNGQFYLKGLFYETSNDKSTVVYTLKTEDYQGYPSLYRLYMEERDPSEYNFANKYFYSWEHFKALASREFFLEYLTIWRDDLAAQLLSEGLEKIREIAAGTTNGAFAAQKYLLERGWEKSDKPSKMGRPKKEAEKPSILDVKRTKQTIDEDFERIMKEMN